MSSIGATITYKENGKIHRADGDRLIFSSNRCFALDGGEEDKVCLRKIEQYLAGKEGLAIAGTGPFAEYLLSQLPDLKNKVCVVLQNDWKTSLTEFAGLPVSDIASAPPDIKTVFIAETLTDSRNQWRKQLGNGFEVIDTDILLKLDPLSLPTRSWSKDPDCIYPIDIPNVQFDSGKDFILIDCPARNLALMPNGLAYVHNAIKKTSLNFQTVDLDIIAYHRYHTYRLLDSKSRLFTPTGREMHFDPWLAEAYEEWGKADTLAYFEPFLEEVVTKLTLAKPKMLGLSVQGCNINFSREVVRRLKKLRPELLVIVGGYSAYQPSVARILFPEADYICVGEADLTVGPLLEALNRGEFPRDTPGVLSVFDSPDRKYAGGGMPHELDTIEMARYDWTDLKLYRNHNHYQLTPIIATRGCRWSKCTFCGERFFWRARSPKLVVDEFEYLHDQGCDLFMFNESDLNGNPKILLEICEEIVRRRLKLRLTGQLRISRHSDRKFFDSLRAGGFTALRFGVDAWSENTLKLQKKGYTVPMIIQNLKDCWEAGIYTEVNTVLGIPGETDDDIERTIELKGIVKPHTGRVSNINKLMLIHGSVYWEDPAKHGIKFKNDESWEEIKVKYPSYVPAELWYSENPFIDENVRVERFKRVVQGMTEMGYDMGAFAKQNIERIETGNADDRLRGDGQSAQLYNEGSESDSPAQKNQSDMRVDSIYEQSDVSSEPPKRVFQFNGEFYGQFNRRSAAETTALAPVENGPDNLRGPAVPAAYHRLVHLSRTAYKVWKTQGRDVMWFRVITKLNHSVSRLKVRWKLRDGQVHVRRDYSSMIEMVEKHPSGYVIFKVRDKYYALDQRFAFDKDKADNDSYPKGKCYVGSNARDVIFQIEGQSATREAMA